MAEGRRSSGNPCPVHSPGWSPCRGLAAGIVVVAILYFLEEDRAGVVVMADMQAVERQQEAAVALHQGCPGRIASHSMAAGLVALVVFRFPLFGSICVNALGFCLTSISYSACSD